MGVLQQLSALSRQARGEEPLIRVAAVNNCDLGMDQCSQLGLLVAEIRPGIQDFREQGSTWRCLPNFYDARTDDRGLTQAGN